MGIRAKDLRIGNLIMIKTSNDSWHYIVSNIGGYKRIFPSKKDEENYKSSIDEQIKKGLKYTYHDEMMVGISGGARTGERLVESKLKPIPLTEQWLLKFGFNVYLQYLEYKSIRVSNIHTNGEVHLQIGSFPISIRHVHELQNLYHSLYKEELTIKN